MMKTLRSMAVLTAIGALMAAGCGKKEASPNAPTLHPLGSKVSAGPYVVTLAMREPIIVSTAFFTATITEAGRPVTDAAVKVHLRLSNVPDAIPYKDLKNGGDGSYSAPGDLTQPGTYRADVIVTSGSKEGYAPFTFDAAP